MKPDRAAAPPLSVAAAEPLLDRRQLLLAGLAAPFALARPAVAGDVPVYVADMHFHLFFVGRKRPQGRLLSRDMAAGHATLLAWALVTDVPWIKHANGTFRQSGTPAPGEALAWFREDMARIKTYLAGESLKVVRTPDDVARALKGDPHVVLASEGSTFLDDDIDRLDTAHELGLRHLQLVHFLRNPIADFQTEAPQHGGLTDFGRKVVERCNRLGILIDLAHCTSATVKDVLAISTKPVVWSHSSIAREGAGRPTAMWQTRQLPLADARAIAAKGGVVGLWALPSDVGSTPESYADRLAEMADLIGEDHAGIGTDRNGVARPAVASFADLQRVVHRWEKRGLSATRIRKLAIGNYARVLSQALAP